FLAGDFFAVAMLISFDRKLVQTGNTCFPALAMLMEINSDSKNKIAKSAASVASRYRPLLLDVPRSE
ncbi:hypothetical protein, partial [Limnohabitans sp.]|uniref:hypothetical protein n=1 Tax=Limnohabitans sp. TaxID=1907725 RepID=UPI00391CD967